MHNNMAVAGSHIPDQRTLLFIGNRWINTIYTNYGVIKQRILLEILQQLQPSIKKSLKGARIDLPRDNHFFVDLDMGRVVNYNYNNYSQVRKALKEMAAQPIDLYADPSFKKPIGEIYETLPALIEGFAYTPGNRIVELRIGRQVLQLLLQVKHEGHYTKFDRQTIDYARSCKYVMPIYTMICSYAKNGGFTKSTAELRKWLQIDQKYKGFDNMSRKVLDHVQRELEISGKYCFNYSTVKTGRNITQVVFKVFANKAKFDYNQPWLKIQRALHEELPYYMALSEEQHDQFNYLLNGGYDLDKVYEKLQHIHKALVKNKENQQPVRRPAIFPYIIKALHREFPPPG